MKMAYKLLTLMLVMTMVFSAVMPTVAYAFNSDKMFKDLENTPNIDVGPMAELAGKILGFLRSFSLVAAVIILTIIGLQFMFGSPDKKAEYKEKLVPLAVGIVVVVAATSIVSFVFNFFNNK